MKNKKWEIRKKIKLIQKSSLLVFCLFLISYFLLSTYALNSNPASPPRNDPSGPILGIESYRRTEIPTFTKGGQKGFSKVIKEIGVEGLTRIEQEELIDLICFDVSDTFNMKKLSAGIRRAFKKGIFLDIRAVSEPYDDGIKLKYIVKEIPIIEEISVAGNENFSTREIKKTLFYKDGEDFKEEFLNKARFGLLNFYQRKGFNNAAVKIVVEEAKKPSLVNIHINIKEGQPLIIENIDVPDDAKRNLKISEGDIFDRDVLDNDLKKLRDYYKTKNYINPIVGPYEFKNGNLIIPFKRGQKVELSFKGNSVFSTKGLETELPFVDDGEVLDESIKEAVERIRKLYLGKGYYYAQIAAGVEYEEKIIRVSLFIFEGKRVVLKKVGFDGIAISRDAIKGIIPLEENKPYNENLLNPSKESLIRFYNALGYLKMDVANIKKDFQKDGSELNLEFIVHEGPQTKIKSIKIIGNKDITATEIKNVLQLAEESPYNMIDIGDARYRVLALYGRSGYVDAHVDVESVIDNDKAFLTFKITENRPSVIGKIILRGNYKTKAKILWREFSVKKGNPYNYEEFLKIKQRLYKLGLFNEVSIDMLESGSTLNGKLVKDVVVSLKEGKAGSVEIGLGYGEYERLRGSFGISYRNLGGYNRQIGLNAEMSSVEKRHVFNFSEPWFFNKPSLSLNVFLMKEDTRSVNLDTNETLYKIDRLSLLVDIEKELTEKLKANLNYEYSFVDTKDVEPGVILSKEDTGTLAIGSVSPSLFYDTRDNPFDPASGSLHGIVLKFASKAFLSETEFIKGTFQSSWFFQLKKGIVFACSLRGGAAYSFDEIKELPLIERFFLGGRTTVRGYSHDTLGPKGSDDNPTGGNVFALGNGEFRFSLGRGFGLVTFIDAGNVWRLAKDISSKLKYTAGAGFRYNTPVGPIRIDYGHKLDREEDESSGEVHFSFGHAF